MVKLLAGIKMAATMGDKFPLTANDSPTILYRIETMNAVQTKTLFALHNSIN